MNNESTTLEKHPLLVIPYRGKTEDHISKLFKEGMREMLPNNIKPRIAFKDTKVVHLFRSKIKLK